MQTNMSYFDFNFIGSLTWYSTAVTWTFLLYLMHWIKSSCCFCKLTDVTCRLELRLTQTFHCCHFVLIAMLPSLSLLSFSLLLLCSLSTHLQDCLNAFGSTVYRSSSQSHIHTHTHLCCTVRLAYFQQRTVMSLCSNPMLTLYILLYYSMYAPICIQLSQLIFKSPNLKLRLQEVSLGVQVYMQVLPVLAKLSVFSLKHVQPLGEKDYNHEEEEQHDGGSAHCYTHHLEV